MDKHYVSYGSCPAGSCGASKDITGCRFSISPMSDDFINIILSSISKVDTSKLWSKTDKLSTIYRGKRCHVLDALKACFIYSYRKDVHSTMEITKKALRFPRKSIVFLFLSSLPYTFLFRMPRA